MKNENLDQNSDHYFLAGVIEEFRGKMAVIKINDGQELLWPIKDLPADCEIKTKVRLILTTSKSDQEEREKIAKTVLNKILKNTEQKDVSA